MSSISPRSRDASNGDSIARTLNPTPFTLSEATLVDAISALAKIVDQDVLEQVVESLDPRRDIPNILLSPLKEMEAKSQNSLIALFVTHRFTAISEGTLQSLLKGRSYSQLMELWDLVIKREQELFAQQVLSSIIQQKIVFSTSELGANKVLNWLNGTTWDDVDQKIVDEAIEGSRDLLFMLERAVQVRHTRAWRYPGLHRDGLFDDMGSILRTDSPLVLAGFRS